MIVVDDGSTDATAELADRAGGPVTVLSGPGGGPAAARNLGAARAAASLLAFCDADVFPAPGWLQAGVDALAAADIVQGRVLPDPHATLGPFDRTLWITSLVGLWEAANLFVRRELFERAGGFEDWLWPPNGKPLGEDVLFGYRVQRLGGRPAFCAQALAHHAVFPRDWREYALERGRLQYFPAIARRVPELRETFMHRRLFLSERSASFDAALAGGVLALAIQSPWPLAASAPYLRRLRTDAGRAGTRGPRSWAVAAADLAADAVGLAAMVRGSVRNRTPVL